RQGSVRIGFAQARSGRKQTAPAAGGIQQQPASPAKDTYYGRRTGDPRTVPRRRENDMSQYGVVAAEIARARIFTLEEAEVPEFDGGPNLVERRALENPQRKASEADIWTDTRRGAHREHIQGQRVQQTTGIPHHNYDEHREQNERDNNIAFAKLVVDELERVIKRNRLKRVVLCAE